MAKLTLDDVEYETDDFTEEQNTIEYEEPAEVDGGVEQIGYLRIVALLHPFNWHYARKEQQHPENKNEGQEYASP